MIIGISGHIGSGKTKLAEILCDKYGYEPKAFAGKLKQIASILTGLPLAWMYDRGMKNRFIGDWGMTIGELQQRLGTEAIRNNLNFDAWILALFMEYDGMADWSISDVRFNNEANSILEMGGIMVRIDGSRTGPGGRNPNHSSETLLDDYDEFDYRFTNDGTIQDLEKHAANIIEIARRKIND